MAAVQRIQLGYNNVYLVDDGGERVLVDAGPDYEGAAAALRDAIAQPRPDAVLVTHAHMDHAGLGAWWLAAGVRVLLSLSDHGAAQAPAVRALRELDHLERYARACGA